MGSCFSTSRTFQGQGRTLNESSPTTPAAASTANASNAGRRLGGISAGTVASSSQDGQRVASGTSDAEREARAKAAERRISQQAAKGTPSHGKLSKQLEHQRNTNPLSENNDNNQPQRLVWD